MVCSLERSQELVILMDIAKQIGEMKIEISNLQIQFDKLNDNFIIITKEYAERLDLHDDEIRKLFDVVHREEVLQQDKKEIKKRHRERFWDVIKIGLGFGVAQLPQIVKLFSIRKPGDP